MKTGASLQKKLKGKKGFTLVELVIVIAVLAIIAAIAIPTVTNVISNANSAADKSNAQSIEMAVKSAQTETAAYATTQSKSVVTMGLAASGSTTVTADATVKLPALLSAYGVSSDVVGKPKVSGDKFFYNTNNGKVTASTSAPTDDATHWKQLSVTAGGETTFQIKTDSTNNSVSLDWIS